MMRYGKINYHFFKSNCYQIWGLILSIKVTGKNFLGETLWHGFNQKFVKDILNLKIIQPTLDST